MQPLSDPPMCYNWLPPPPQRMHFTLQNAKYFEGLVQKFLCAINYVEASLQALPRCVDDDKPAFACILQGHTPAIKVLMHINTSQLCQWVYLRSDHSLENRSRTRSNTCINYVAPAHRACANCFWRQLCFWRSTNNVCKICNTTRS